MADSLLGPVELVVAAFSDEQEASKVLKQMRQWDREGTIAILNAAELIKRVDGKVTMRETEDVPGGRGALFGAIVGGLVGLLGGPAGAIVGAAAGAATGGIAASQIDMGFDDAALRDIQESLTPGSSAVIALVQHEWVDRVVAILDELNAVLFRQTLKTEIAAQLAADQAEATQEAD